MFCTVVDLTKSVLFWILNCLSLSNLKNRHNIYALAKYLCYVLPVCLLVCLCLSLLSSHSLFLVCSFILGRSVELLYASDCVGVLGRHTKGTCEDWPSCLSSVIAVLCCIFRAERMESAFFSFLTIDDCLWAFVAKRALLHTQRVLWVKPSAGQYLLHRYKKDLGQ